MKDKREAPRASSSEEIVTLTDSATCVLREKLSAESSRRGTEISGMRLSLRSGGCAGMSYEMSYAISPLSSDIRQEFEGITLYIDPLATMFLLGTVIDHQRDKLSSGFTFTSPRATGRCGCGESVSFG